MVKVFKMLSALCMLLCPLAATAGDMTIGLLYDEGLGARAIFNEKYFAQATVGYNVAGASMPYYAEHHYASLLVGGGMTVIKTDRLSLNAFVSFKEELRQFDTDSTFASDNMTHQRYNVWNSIVRIGVAPEVYITDKFSIEYKIGLQTLWAGSHYKLNDARTDTESLKSDYVEFGTFGGFDNIAQNISIIYYF